MHNLLRFTLLFEFRMAEIPGGNMVAAGNKSMIDTVPSRFIRAVPVDVVVPGDADNVGNGGPEDMTVCEPFGRVYVNG